MLQTVKNFPTQFARVELPIVTVETSSLRQPSVSVLLCVSSTPVVLNAWAS